MQMMSKLYMQCDTNTDFTNLINCLEHIQSWSNSNFLKLNNNKTKILAVSSSRYKAHKITQLNIMGETIEVESSVKNLGFILDDNLNMGKQINQICSQGYGMLRNLWKISKRVLDKQLRMQLVHSGILCRVDYCNSLYTSLPNTQTYKLQKLINAAARFILNIRGKDRFEHITPHLQQLHFLPVKYRTQFKNCLVAYKCINNDNNDAPSYLVELVSVRQPNPYRDLRRDSDIFLLDYKNPEAQDYRNRSFSYTAPNFWNNLPFSVRNSSSVDAFKSSLKTFYFTKWINEKN